MSTILIKTADLVEGQQESREQDEDLPRVLVEQGGVDPRASFVHFVYPFVFDPEQFSARVAAVESARWQGRAGPLPIWRKQAYAESYLLPHVARYLNPPDDTTAPTAKVWKLNDAIRNVYGVAGRADWRLRISSGKASYREIPFDSGRTASATSRPNSRSFEWAPAC